MPLDQPLCDTRAPGRVCTSSGNSMLKMTTKASSHQALHYVQAYDQQAPYIVSLCNPAPIHARGGCHITVIATQHNKCACSASAFFAEAAQRRPWCGLHLSLSSHWESAHIHELIVHIEVCIADRHKARLDFGCAGIKSLVRPASAIESLCEPDRRPFSPCYES